jgi:hypothetical protein
MFGRIAAAAALIALAGCAGMESAGRNASRSPAPRVASAPPAATPAPAPARTATLPPPQAAPSTPAPTTTAALPPPAALASPPPAARAQAAPPPAVRTQAAPPPPAEADRPVVTASRSGEENVVVPGARERQVQPPNGDPRSNTERMQDIRAWDQCVMRVQGAAEADPMRPQLDTPEDYCRNSLGMATRTSIPQSRLERR